MKKTHCESFLEEIGPYRSYAQRILKVLEEVAADDEPFWFQRIFENGYVETKNGKRLRFPKNGEVNNRPDGTLIGAFLYELTCRRLSKNDYSMSRMRMGDYIYAYHSGLLSGYMHREQAQSGTEVAYHITAHQRHGSRVYDVSPGLAQKLKDTELRGLHCSDVRLPFPSIYIQVPEELNFITYNIDTGMHPVVGIYITEDPQAKREDSGLCRYYADPDTKSVVDDKGRSYADHETVREWAIMIIGGASKDSSGKDREHDDSLYFYKLYMFDSTLEEALQELANRSEKNLNDPRMDAVVKHMREHWPQMFRWMLNVVMYATYSDPGEKIIGCKEARHLWERIAKCPSKSSKRNKLLQKAKTINKRERIILGRGVAFDSPQAASGQGMPLNIRVKVSGHWRRVRCGKGFSDRRWKFVEPFWRGPELGEVVTRNHRLK